MCGRYALYSLPEEIKLAFNTENIISYNESYNAAPSQSLPIIIKNRMGLAKWGFKLMMPATSKPSQTLINARSETVHEKNTFKTSWAKKRRCLIPCNGFYEWKKDSQTKKATPYFIKPEEDKIFALAGIWKKEDNSVYFTIITKSAEPSIKDIHHRMPVIIKPPDYHLWFSENNDNIHRLINASSPMMMYYKVGQSVGNIRNNDKELITPIQNQGR
jgi:putative SOS response-associated peptidase YedK